MNYNYLVAYYIEKMPNCRNLIVTLKSYFKLLIIIKTAIITTKNILQSTVCEIVQADVSLKVPRQAIALPR